MSHSDGAVRFSDGTIMYFKYYNTVSIAIPKLYITQSEMWNHWDNFDFNQNYDEYHNNNHNQTCNHVLEDVEIMVVDGTNRYWEGKACRKCNNLIKHLEPRYFEEQQYWYGTENEEDENIDNWNCIDGEPDWSPWKK